MKKKLISKISRLHAIRFFSIFIDSVVNYHWNTFPFGNTIKGKKEDYMNLWENEKSNIYSSIDKFEKNKKYALDKLWLDNLALHTQVVIKPSSLCWQHGRVLFAKLSNWLNDNPIEDAPVVTIWETGTARGFSALCMSKALEDQQRLARIVTFDVLPHNQAMYWNCIDDYDGPKTRSELLRPWKNLSSKYIIFQQGDSNITLKRTSAERIHFAFLDGSHVYTDVLNEFNAIKKYQKPGDIIIFDDYSISQFPGLVKAVDFICEDSNYLREDISAHENRGYVIATKQ